MPQPFNNAVMTNAGARLLTRAQAGEIKVEFTRIAVGDGSYTADEETLDALREQTALKSPKNSYALSDIAVFSDHSVKVTALITNQDPITGHTLVNAGYYINEMGLFARVKGGPDSTEVLYSITTTAGANGDFMPPYNGYNPAQITQDYYVTVDNSAQTFIQTGAGAVALMEDLLEVRGQVARHVEESDGEFARIWSFLEDMYCLAAPDDIDSIISGTYVDDDTMGGGFFEVGTDEDIDNIINGSYVGTETGTGGGDVQGGVTGQMVTEIVENAFREV